MRVWAQWAEGVVVWSEGVRPRSVRYAVVRDRWLDGGRLTENGSVWIRRVVLHLDIHRGTCGDGKGDRYLWWKRLETMMTSDGVVRAAQLSPGTWAFSASDDSLKGLISALLIPPHSSFHKHATCMGSIDCHYEHGENICM